MSDVGMSTGSPTCSNTIVYSISSCFGIVLCGDELLQ